MSTPSGATELHGWYVAVALETPLPTLISAYIESWPEVSCWVPIFAETSARMMSSTSNYRVQWRKAILPSMPRLGSISKGHILFSSSVALLHPVGCWSGKDDVLTNFMPPSSHYATYRYSTYMGIMAREESTAERLDRRVGR